MKIASLARIIFSLFIFLSANAFAHEVRLEGGLFKTVSNRFAIPNPGGSRVSVKNDSYKFYGRGQATFQISDNSYIRMMAAPFQANYSYATVDALNYNGVSFPANSVVDIKYQFNSYRLGYIYKFAAADSLQMQVGAVGKIRQAKIALSGSGLSTSYDNVGFVPLLNVGFAWMLFDPWELRFDLDGAAAKQGRAFDGSVELFQRLDKEGSGISAGIRILEGGADNSKVYTFALVDYGFLAVTYGF